MDYDQVWRRVTAPGQYVGGEPNGVVKPPETVKLRLALCHPDAYLVGMSHHGLRVLYHVANAIEGVQAERVFSVMPDMERELRQAGLPLATLETRAPLSSCDAVAFSLCHELAATNVLQALDLGGIPFTRDERQAARREGRRLPLVIAGGHAAFNPEPYADWIDAFLVGDGEESLPELLRLLLDDAERETALADVDRFDALLRRVAAAVPGTYVPALYGTETTASGFIVTTPPPEGSGIPFPVTARRVADFDAAPSPTASVVPVSQTAHERVVVEVMRGCPNGCRFCQAGFITRPVRTRSPATVCRLAVEGVRATGFDEVGLLSLSASDHPGLPEMAAALDRELGPERISISLGSLRVDRSLPELVKRLRSVRPGSLTVAPEAGSERLRAVINKNIADADLLDGARAAYEAGFHQIKLYFMLGLPTETDDDVLAIGKLGAAVAACRAKGPKFKPAAQVSASNFVPKPHTPFQWEGSLPAEEFERRQRLLASSIDKRRVAWSGHDARTSRLEAVFARGDRRLGAATVAAYRAGARFDGWTEHFRPDAWEAALREAGVDADKYAGPRDPDERLPWDHIDCGVRPEFLRRERDKALRGERTARCGPSCAACGVPDCTVRHAE